MEPLSETDILKAALYTACAQLAWHQDKRGRVGHIVHSARECLALVAEPDERERTAEKIKRMNQT
jgi:hypothetical protein